MRQRYRRPPEYVAAEQFTDLNNPPDDVEPGQDGVFRVMSGSKVPHIIKPGHWLVVDERGTITVMTDGVFQAIFEPAEGVQ